MGINQKKAGLAIVITDKIDFMSGFVTRDKKKGYCIMIKCHLKIITIVNIYAPNVRAHKYIKHVDRLKVKNWQQ